MFKIIYKNMQLFEFKPFFFFRNNLILILIINTIQIMFRYKLK